MWEGMGPTSEKSPLKLVGRTEGSEGGVGRAGVNTADFMPEALRAPFLPSAGKSQLVDSRKYQEERMHLLHGELQTV